MLGPEYAGKELSNSEIKELLNEKFAGSDIKPKDIKNALGNLEDLARLAEQHDRTRQKKKEEVVPKTEEAPSAEVKTEDKPAEKEAKKEELPTKVEEEKSEKKEEIKKEEEENKPEVIKQEAEKKDSEEPKAVKEE